MLRPYEVERLALVLINALEGQLLRGEGGTTADEVLSAYMTACNTACIASVREGADSAVIRQNLLKMADALPIVSPMPAAKM